MFTEYCSVHLLLSIHLEFRHIYSDPVTARTLSLSTFLNNTNAMVYV